MGRLIMMVFVLMLPGCAAVAPVLAIPGYFVDDVVYQFRGAERSLPADMQRTLAAIQAGLRSVQLEVDLIERIDKGYALLFSNAQIDGNISLREETPKLTTIYIQVHRGLSREDSVEKAILDAIEEQETALPSRSAFDYRHYGRLYDRVSVKGRVLGSFRPGARLAVSKTGTDGWLRTKLPSGRNGYLKARVSQFKKTNSGRT